MVYLNNHIEHEIFKLRNLRWNKVLANMDKNSKPFWKITKMLRKKTHAIPVLKQQNKRLVTGKEKAEVFAKTFFDNDKITANLSDDATKTLVQQTADSISQNPVPFNYSNHVRPKEIANIIKRLRTNKSPGLDNIPNICLKNLPRTGIVYLSHIINACLKLAHFPNKWKKAKVIPIYKPNKPADQPTSYRPISLLSSLGKLMERVLKLKIEKFLDEESVLLKEQFGFRTAHEALHAVTRITQHIKNNLANKKSTALVLLDVQAAFDSVWHEGVIYKMLQMGFPLYLTHMIRSFLRNRYAQVYTQGSKSEIYEITTGLPQGSALSPTLYNIFTTDFPTNTNCYFSIFADDAAIYSTSSELTKIMSDMQGALNSIFDYFSKWKIKLNAEKTQAIFFTRKRKACHLPDTCLTLNGVDIQWTNDVKYLGVTLDKKLTFASHITHTVHKCNILIRTLYPFINRKSKLRLGNKTIIFKTLFHAILLFGAPAWYKCAGCHIHKLQVTQNKILKMIYNLPWHFSTKELHKRAGMELISNCARSRALSFYGANQHSSNPLIRQLTPN